MPKLFIQASQGTYGAGARVRIAKALTDLGMACEKLADTAKVRAGVWVMFNEVGPDAVFSGGTVATTPLIALIVYALEGGLDDESRAVFIKEATAILGMELIGDGPHPIYVSIQETPEVNWGMYGAQVSLHKLRSPD
jgi:phenylpyruvate tautomerase PptA (4-oxalocrotonate tautomerase family)